MLDRRIQGKSIKKIKDQSNNKKIVFKDAQLLPKYIDVYRLTPSLTGRLAISDISPLFVDRFGEKAELIWSC